MGQVVETLPLYETSVQISRQNLSQQSVQVHFSLRSFVLVVMEVHKKALPEPAESAMPMVEEEGQEMTYGEVEEVEQLKGEVEEGDIQED